MSVPRPCIEVGCHRFAYKESRCRPCYLAAQMERNRRPERAIYRDPAYRMAVNWGTCHICGGTGADTRDHVISIARGGTNDAENIKPSHRVCNSRKGAK